MGVSIDLLPRGTAARAGRSVLRRSRRSHKIAAVSYTHLDVYKRQDVEHALLGVDGADLDDLLAVFDGRLGGVLVKLDVVLDELHRAEGSGRDGLDGGAGEPVDDRAAGDEAEQERCVQQRQVRDLLGDEMCIRDRTRPPSTEA